LLDPDGIVVDLLAIEQRSDLVEQWLQLSHPPEYSLRTAVESWAERPIFGQGKAQVRKQEARRGLVHNPDVSRRRQSATAAAVVCALSLPIAAGATTPSLGGHLQRDLSAPGVASALSGAMAIDLTTGQIVFAHNADTPLQPASNEKLCVSFTALRELGPTYRFRTEVLGEGRRVGNVWHGRLVLKGYGDPTLSAQDLGRLADRIRARGIRRVTGHVVGDDSWFDRRWTVAGWLPSFAGAESPPLSALVVDRGWRKGRPVREPALAAAATFDRMLRARGVEARDAVTGTARSGAVRLAKQESRQLSRLLTAIDADSDNFAAELLLKAIGRELLGKGTSAAGASVVRRDLTAAGVPLAGVRIVDGSGLSRENRITARELATLLVAIWHDPKLRSLIRGSLAVAGMSGTLEHRLESRPARGRVRAKTGTTAVASALSGYVGSRYAFVVVQNGSPIASWSAREAQDRFVTRLAAMAASS
jgi:serine-type D-Ala-D-Ala carboxypeptidase/endopeptidase (penicillin-binding protein 4)